MKNNDTMLTDLDIALVKLLGALTMPLEASEDSEVVVYPKETIWEALNTLTGLLEERMELKDE